LFYFATDWEIIVNIVLIFNVFAFYARNEHILEVKIKIRPEGVFLV